MTYIVIVLYLLGAKLEFDYSAVCQGMLHEQNKTAHKKPTVGSCLKSAVIWPVYAIYRVLI